MKPIILLDVDGVLNPESRPGPGGRAELKLACGRKALLRRLARCGRIAWVSSWPADVTAGLEQQIELDVEPLRVTLLVRPGDETEPTPKLRSVTRWLERMEAADDAAWDSIVWIDDVLGPDARDWAAGYQVPVLLQKPVPDQGLMEQHVVDVEAFVATHGDWVPGPR
jgi:hypothetical protein